MSQEPGFNGDKQHGAAMLAGTVILLLLTGLITIYLANTSRKEQQISANQYRTEQSLNAAMAGIDWAVDYYNKYGLDAPELDASGDLVPDGVVDYGPPFDDTSGNPTDTNADPCKSNCVSGNNDCPKRWCIGSDSSTDDPLDHLASGDLIVKSRTFFCNSTDLKFWTDPENCSKAIDLNSKEDLNNNVGIISIGYSDDNTARRVVVVQATPTSPFPGPEGPRNPLTARGSVEFRGNVSVVNRYHVDNIWTGDPLVFNDPHGGNKGSVETYIRNPDYEFSPDPEDRFDPLNREVMISEIVSGGGNTIPGELPATSTKHGVNSDVLDGDPSLSQLSGGDPGSAGCPVGTDKFFCAFFSFENMAALAEAAEIINCADVNNATGLVYINGDCTLNGGDLLAGTLTDPAFIVIDGDFTIRGGDYHGVLYVAGDLKVGGNFVLRGSMIVEDDYIQEPGVGGGGTGQFIYDKFSVNPDDGFNNLRTIVPGTSRDWSIN